MKNNRILKRMVISIIEIVIIIAIIFLYDNRKNKIESTNVNEYKNNEEVIVKSENTLQNNNTIDNEEKKQNNIEISTEKVSTWNNNNIDYSTIQIIIKNNSKQKIENWKLIVNTNLNLKIENTWNGNFNIDGNKIIITSVEYNNTIESDKDIKIGGTFSFNGDLNLLDYELYSNDKLLDLENNKIDESNEKLNLEIEDLEDISKEQDISKIEIENESPYDIHGKLRVQGQDIVDKKGNRFQIQGVSTHSIFAFPQFINSNVFKFTKQELNCNTIRLCVYSNPADGYSEALYSNVDEGVKYATELGMYVIIDWHILLDNDPNINKESAKAFFTRMAELYKDYDNILYEICNEPNGNTTWDMVKSYASEIIPIIRGYNKDSIIIVGTPDYCKNLEDVANSPIEVYENLLYSFHFYTASHKQELREKLDLAYNKKLPIIVSEFGLSEYSGNGNIDVEEADKWINYLRERNIGYICWNISNKDESSALLNPFINNIDDLKETDLSPAGQWIKNKYNN